MISSGNSSRPVQTLGISFHNRKRRSPHFELASTGSSILCSPLIMRWRCSGERYRSVLPAVASTGSPIASLRSPPKRANSTHPENGQRLAGYVGLPEKSEALKKGLRGQIRDYRPKVVRFLSTNPQGQSEVLGERRGLGQAVLE